MTDDKARTAIAALNDVVSELAAGLAAGDPVSKGWAYAVVETLERQTFGLGYSPNVTTEQLSHWQGEE